MNPMDAASLARHSIEGIGPSVFARKIYDAPVFGGQAKQTKWLAQIPLTQFPGYQMNFFVQEDYTPEPDGVFAVTLSVRSQSPPSREHPYATSTICSDIKLIQTTFDKRADAYRILHAFMNDMQQLCGQEARYHYIAQEIVNRARALFNEHGIPAPAQEGMSPSELAGSVMNRWDYKMTGTYTQMGNHRVILFRKDNPKVYSFDEAFKTEAHAARYVKFLNWLDSVFPLDKFPTKDGEPDYHGWLRVSSDRSKRFYSETDTEVSARELASVLLEVEIEEPRTPIAGLRRIFQKGTTWTRVNTRFPTQIAGEKMVEKGEPVDLTVVAVTGECVVFSSPFGDTYLSWPRPPVYAEANEQEVRILDRQGVWLTYTRKAVAEGMTAAELAYKSIDPTVNMKTQFTVSGSWGIHHCRRDGTVIRFDPQVDTENLEEFDKKQVEVYSSITKFNVPEWKARHPGWDTQASFQDIDILDMGFWLPDGTYEGPDETWRGIHAMESADPELMRSIANKAMWSQEWEHKPHRHGEPPEPTEGFDPLKINGEHYLNIRAPMYGVFGYFRLEVFPCQSRDEHENAMYMISIRWTLESRSPGEESAMGYRAYAEGYFRQCYITEGEWEKLKAHVEEFVTTHIRPKIESEFKAAVNMRDAFGGTARTRLHMNDYKHSFRLRWAKWMKPWNRSWRDVYEKTVYDHYNGEPPAEIVAKLIELRRADTAHEPGSMFEPIKEAQMTAQDLAVQAVGLPVMAGTHHVQKGTAVTLRHYQWVSDHAYKIKITLVEIFQTDQIPGDKERRVPSYRIQAKPWVETSPTIYTELTAVTLFDEVPPEKKGEMYTHVWKMLKDIESAHQAGLEAADMASLLQEIMRVIRSEGESLRS